MLALSKLQEFLDRNEVSYGHTVHPRTCTAQQLACAGHLPENQVAKTVVFVCDHGYGTVVLPAGC